MGRIEMRARVTPFAATPLEIVHQRIDVQSRDVRIEPQIVFAVEQARLGQQVLFSEQDCHRGVIPVAIDLNT